MLKIAGYAVRWEGAIRKPVRIGFLTGLDVFTLNDFVVWKPTFTKPGLNFRCRSQILPADGFFRKNLPSFFFRQMRVGRLAERLF